MARTKLIVFAITCFGTLFFCSSLFVNAYTTPKWYFFIGGVILWGISCIIDDKIDTSRHSYIISITLLAQAIYGILQFYKVSKSANGFPVTGSFDNPAGFAAALAIGIPFCLQLFVKSRRTIFRLLNYFIISIIVLAIISSGSRSGIFTVTILFIYKVIKQCKYSYFLRSATIVAMSAAIITGLYYLRKDSADGRILIWKCSIPMLQKALCTGYGTGGFEANYMKYQAQYFKSNPDSPYQKLADNIQHPFSEYIRIICNYGIVGAFFFLICSVYFVYCYFKSPTIEKETAILCLGCFAIFSLFSYPLSYPFTWLVCIYSIHILTKDFTSKYIRKINSKPLFNNLLLTAFILLILQISYKTYKVASAEIQWKNCASRSFLRSNSKTILPKFQDLEQELDQNRLFLYNYCNVLYQYQDYEKSLAIAFKCRALWANYNLELLIGRIYQRKRLYKKAEYHYLIAHYMCLSGFYRYTS